MDGLKSLDQLIAEGSMSYPQKESSKEKTKEPKPIANSSNGYSTIGRVADVSTPPLTGVVQKIEANKQKQLTIEQTALARAERRSRSIKALQIDDYVFQLVMEGLVDEDYSPFAAKCCTVLGLQRVHKIVLQVRQGEKVQNPQRLLAWKLNGALQLHYKKQLYLDSSDTGSRQSLPTDDH